ncbi:MAG: transposase [Bacteroidales bacterium]|nr:transposase [Bacteroidales bacterium]
MPKNTDKRSLPRQHKRSHYHNYRKRSIYMLTLCTEGRLPILGTLCGDSTETATVRPTALGEEVLRCWNNIPTIQKHLAQKKTEQTGLPCNRVISLLDCQLMPDHFHGIIFIHEDMDIAIGDVVRGFMAGCTKAYHATMQPLPDNKIKRPLWEKGYHDRILCHAGQLDNMIAYLRDNPRRLWLKKMFPNNFAVLRNVQYGSYCFSSVGNIWLLDCPMHAIHVRSRFSDEESRQYMNDCIRAARGGEVLVGAFISPKEKLVLDVALKEKLAVICLVPYSFSEFYKPSGAYSDACAQGLILFLSEASDENQNKRISRQECNHLNTIAENLAEISAATTNYTSSVPPKP